MLEVRTNQHQHRRRGVVGLGGTHRLYERLLQGREIHTDHDRARALSRLGVPPLSGGHAISSMDRVLEIYQTGADRWAGQ